MRRIAYGLGWIVCVVSMATATAWASGGGGGFGGGGPSYSGSTSRTDPAYERGKKVAKGRAPSIRGLKVCVAVSSEEPDEDGQLIAKKLSARVLRPLRETSPNELARRLVDCKDVEQRAAGKLSRRDLSDLVHYLNKRYKLRL